MGGSPVGDAQGQPTGSTLGVVIVDDDEISGAGITAVLRAVPELTIVASTDHTGALNGEVNWTEVGVVVVDAADDRQHRDHFPGVAVVEEVRQHRTRAEALIVVVTGHVFDTSIRLRMHEAGADLYFHRDELRTSSVLVDAVLRPDRYRKPLLDPDADIEELSALGVGRSTKVNDALRYYEQHPLPGRSRRGVINWRAKFNAVANLQPMNADGRTRDSAHPDRTVRTPSLPQIDRFVEFFTRTRRQ
jgi:CheY-like chemotaxis protein